ncbi:MAG: hypothetical protein LBC86_06645, partial [Oscillospiraceae bacterium]|nr:hypothetical protein [Oscillospiraceae bacterium]
MLFYLSRKETADIFDPVFENIKARKIKCSGEFLNFITVDMKRYTSCRVFLLERKAIEESDDNFIGALKSFQLMSEARVIVICEMKPENDVFFKNLAGVGINDFI